MKISGKLIDIYLREIYSAEVKFENGIINRIERTDTSPDLYIMPGLIDAHVHVESSMVTPGAFAVAAVSRGTVATVSDPHEIANVLGMEGVKFMIEDAAKVPLKFNFGAPSCVPATHFETSGASLGTGEIEQLLDMNEIKYLSEMMNFPGVIYDDPDVLEKIKAARKRGKPVDGHAPGLTGQLLRKYISAGITTDHECTGLAEAKEKIDLGMKVIIREGSAARNLDELKDLFRSDPEMIMLCSDDIHPEMLATRHINSLVAKLIKERYDPFDVIKSCTLNPARHYGLNAGLLEPGQPADFILTDDFREMNILETWIDGIKVFDRGKTLFSYSGATPLNKFNCSAITKEDIMIKRRSDKIRVIEAFDGDLLTGQLITGITKDEQVSSDTGSDILKIVAKDRYNDGKPATAFIKGFGMISGAIAGSVAHDSHNIICTGTNDDDILTAINEVVKMKGGLVVCDRGNINEFPLPIAGIISDRSVTEVASKYEELSEQVKSLGCRLSAPFMTLSFMALLVIPELKLSDKGLFDGKTFEFVPLFVDSDS